METGMFLDTNILFDALYPTRILYSSFHKAYESDYLLKLMSVTITTDTEAQLIATESAQILTLALYNKIRSIDWNELTPDEKDAELKKFRKALEVDPEIKRKKRTTFVVDALKIISLQLQNLSKDEILNNLCPNLPYVYTRELQGKISEHFTIPPTDGSFLNYNELIAAFKEANKQCGAFKLKENQDMDILLDLVLLIRVGARYFNNTTVNYDAINFYSKDDAFKDNFEKIKSHLDKKPKKTKHEEDIADSFQKLTYKVPY